MTDTLDEIGLSTTGERRAVQQRRTAYAMGMWGCLHRVPAARLTELLANPSEINEELYPSTDEPNRLPE